MKEEDGIAGKLLIQLVIKSIKQLYCGAVSECALAKHNLGKQNKTLESLKQFKKTARVQLSKLSLVFLIRRSQA